MLWEHVHPLSGMTCAVCCTKGTSHTHVTNTAPKRCLMAPPSPGRRQWHGCCMTGPSPAGSEGQSGGTAVAQQQTPALTDPPSAFAVGGPQQSTGGRGASQSGDRLAQACGVACPPPPHRVTRAPCVRCARLPGAVPDGRPPPPPSPSPARPSPSVQARGAPLPTNGPEWQGIRAGHLSGLGQFSTEFQELLHSMMAPDPKARPSAFDLLQQLNSNRQTEAHMQVCPPVVHCAGPGGGGVAWGAGGRRPAWL